MSRVWRRLSPLSLCAMLSGCGTAQEAEPIDGTGAAERKSPASAASGGAGQSSSPSINVDARPASGGSLAAGMQASDESGGQSASGAAATLPGGSGSPAPVSGAGGAVAAAGSGGSVAAAAAGAAADGGGTGGAPAAVAYPQLSADQLGQPKQIASGFRLAESPLWDPCTQTLMFADVQGGGGRGVIHRLSADGKSSVFVSDTGNTNGFTYDVDGSLILTQMTGHVARRDKSGMLKTLEPAGSRLHTPDDVVVRSDGTIYFSDGDFCPIGNLLGFGSSLPVYMIKPGSSALTMVGTVGGPNGIELSPDENVLYVAGYGDGTISAFDVSADGAATKRASPLIAGLSNPDSFCLDLAGNLYVGVTSGVQVVRPDGQKVKLIPVNAPAGECTTSGVTNCTFGGEDGKTLYVTTWTTIWKIENMPIPGLDWKVHAQRAVCD